MDTPCPLDMTSSEFDDVVFVFVVVDDGDDFVDDLLSDPAIFCME